MKHLLTAILVATLSIGTAYAEAGKKTICKDVIGKDGKVVKNKDGSVKQQCKTIKIHKKLEGKEVPTKK
jgi:hypothetical protein